MNLKNHIFINNKSDVERIFELLNKGGWFNG